METSTTTCSYFNPVLADGTTTPPGDTILAWNFASSTCATISATSTPPAVTVDFSRGNSAENPLIIQDSGSLVWGLALILFVLTFAVLGTIFKSRS